jgi:hypothetical protein
MSGKNNSVPPQTVAAPDLRYAVLENDLGVQAVLLVNFHMHKEVSILADTIGRQERLATAKAPEIMLFAVPHQARFLISD